RDRGLHRERLVCLARARHRAAERTPGHARTAARPGARDVAPLPRPRAVPPSFRDPANPLPSTGHTIRPVLADAAAGDVELAWIAELTVRPIVYFTLGTIFNLESGDLFERVLAGLSELPVSVVVTV